ncbi:uncharacterized protein LOC141754141 isoform X2 [Sebastes fasciatus]|uniref:uncharacterized protein LOC141754141 isoform X2 n=1 Tax=Sebastes fasciatus TaxID=394691 RepID=UPI003D9F8C81
MLPPNLLIVSMVVFLATTVSMAPVEEQEQEEVEVEATEEGELSEEEEDDDDSQSQDKFEGLIGMQQTTMAVAAAVAVASGGSGVGAAVSSNIHHLSASSSQSAGGRPNGGTAGSSSAAGGQSSSAASQPTGPDGVHSESNGNGQKLLNGGGEGGGRGGADSQTGVLGSFGGGVSQLDYTGECPGAIDPSSHDFLLGLMGGGDPFKPDHMTPPPQLDSAGPAHHSDISIDQSGPGHTSLISGPDQSQSSSLSVSGHSHSAAQGDAAASTSSLQSEAHRVQTDGADSPDTNGNGRQTLLTDTNAGGAESVSGLHIDLTASGLGLTHDVTGGYSHTDLVTMATDSTGTDTVPADPTGTPLDSTPADPTGTPLDSSHPAVTDHTQMAGSVTEQYNPSGQGPEGAENVELEDTC